MNVHLFRHVGTKLFERTNPGNLEVMRRVLGHASLDTLLKHYADLQMAPAVELFDAAVLGLGGEDFTPRRGRVRR